MMYSLFVYCQNPTIAPFPHLKYKQITSYWQIGVTINIQFSCNKEVHYAVDEKEHVTANIKLQWLL